MPVELRSGAPNGPVATAPTVAVTAMAAVHENVQERTSEEEQPWQEAKEMRAVLAQQKEGSDGKEA